MKKSRKLLVLILSLAIGLGLAASVLADPMCEGMGMGMMDMGMMHGPGMMNLTPDQAGQIFDLKEKLRNDTASLRKQMLIKHMELANLWRTDNPDPTAIQNKQKELNSLRDQMQDRMTTFKLNARKIAPNFGRMGMGPGGMGTGPGYTGTGSTSTSTTGGGTGTSTGGTGTSSPPPTR